MSKDLANDIYVNKLFRGSKTQSVSGTSVTMEGIEESSNLKGLNIYGYCKQGDITTLAEGVPPLIFSGYEGLENEISFQGTYYQETREGYNLLDVSSVNTSRNGLTSTLNADGTITTTGIPTINYVQLLRFFITDMLEDGETYTISKTTSTGNIFVQVNASRADGSGTTIINTSGALERSFTVDKTTYSGYTIVIQSGPLEDWGDTERTITQGYMLYKGSLEAKTFEAYGAMPSPDFPSKVQTTVGNNINLFNLETATDNMYLTFTGTLAESSVSSVSDYIEVVANETYTINQGDYSGLTSIPYKRICFFDETQAFISYIGNNETTPILTFTTPDNAKYLRFQYRTTLADEQKLEQGSIATPYSPYGLGSITTTITDGSLDHMKTFTLPIQQEMLTGDYFTKVDGVWKEVHLWKKKIFSSDDIFKPSDYEMILYSEVITDYKISTDSICVSNSFTSINNVVSAGNLVQENDNIITFNQNHDYYRIYVKTSQYPTYTEFNAKITELYNAGTPLIVYYLTETPTYLDCTEEQIEVLDRMNAVEGYNGLNILETDSDLDIIYTITGLELPLPHAPIEITTTEGTTANEISFTLSDGTQSQVLGISITGLYGIPVETGGNYVDENGQRWISDVVNFRAEKIIKNVEFLQLTGNEEWILDETSSEPCFYMYNEDFYSIEGSKYPVLCNRLVYSDIAEIEGICFMGDDHCLFIYPPNEMTTVELFKQWLVENPTYIYYRKTISTTTDISTEEMEAYNSLMTYIGTNTATNDANAYMNVLYITSGVAGNTSMVILFTQDGNTLFGDIDTEYLNRFC